MTRLIYHPVKTSSDTTTKQSPFNAVILEMANSRTLKIACPYLSYERLKQIRQDHSDWKLLTDVDALFRSLRRTDRLSFIGLFRENRDRVRHNKHLHAKVIIADRQALVGSANLTDMGLNQRAEMSVLLTDQGLVDGLDKWFKDIFSECEEFSDEDFEEMVRFANEALPGSSSADREKGRLSLSPGPPVSSTSFNASRRRKKTDTRKPQRVSAKVTGLSAEKTGTIVQRQGRVTISYGKNKELPVEFDAGLILYALQRGAPNRTDVTKTEIYNSLLPAVVKGKLYEKGKYNINRHTRENSVFAQFGLLTTSRKGNEIIFGLSDVGRSAKVNF